MACGSTTGVCDMFSKPLSTSGSGGLSHQRWVFEKLWSVEQTTVSRSQSQACREKGSGYKRLTHHIDTHLYALHVHKSPSIVSHSVVLITVMCTLHMLISLSTHHRYKMVHVICYHHLLLQGLQEQWIWKWQQLSHSVSRQFRHLHINT